MNHNWISVTWLTFYWWGEKYRNKTETHLNQQKSKLSFQTLETHLNHCSMWEQTLHQKQISDVYISTFYGLCINSI